MKKKKIIASSLLGLSILAAGMTLSSCDMELTPTYEAGQTTTTQPTTKPTVQKVTVTFNSNGGSNVTAQSINKGSKATKPANPTKSSATADGVITAYAFAGWYTDSGLTKAFDFNTAVNSNITLYAKWTVTKTYTITFNSNGGTAVTEQKVVGGNKVTKPANPTKASTGQKAYEFAGWYTDSGLTKEYDFNTQVTANLTLNAKWVESVRKYDVTWKNGNVVLKTDKVEYGKIPTYTGSTPQKQATAEYSYTFIGWTPEVSAVTGAVTYNATFTQTKNKYEVKFIDRELEFDFGEFEYGETPTTFYQPTDYQDDQYDYEFLGWSPEISTVTGAITYRATYRETLREYTVTFYDEDGITPLYSHIYKYGETPEYLGETPKKAPTKEKQYTFAGWNNPIDTVTGDCEYRATYTVSAREYKVEWYSEYKDEDDNTKFTDSTWLYGTQMVEPDTTPTYEDSADGQYSYTFDGWLNISNDFDNGIIRFKAVKEEHVKRYTYTFVNDSVESETTDYWGTVITAPADPTKSPTAQYTYAFDGWYTAETGGTKVDFTTDVYLTEDVTYYARFTETVNKYDVKFMVDGVEYGTTQNLDYGTAITKPTTDPEKESTNTQTFSFAGWFTKDGTGDVWGDEVNFTNLTVTGAVTYYAKFTEAVRKYDVKFMNGANQFGETLELEYETQISAPTNNPEKTSTDIADYDFDGWYTKDGTNDDWGTKVVFDANLKVTSAVTYYARFSEVALFNVVFDSKGGSNVTSQKIRTGELATAPQTAPTKETVEADGVTTAYEFAGWYTSTDGGTTLSNTAYDFTTPVNAALTLYAKWNESYKYEVTFDSMGGTPVASAKVDAGTKATAPTTNPTKASTTVDGTITDFAFDSWCTRTGEGTQLSPYVYTPFDFANTNITGVITLYAKWTESYKYVVTFDIDGTTSTLEVAQGTTITTIPNIPLKTGYTAAGWFTRSGDAEPYTYTQFEPTTTITAPLTLYARYTINEYTVNFISDGVAYGIAQNVEYNKKATAPATAPTKNYYDFQYWATRTGDAPNYTYTKYNFDTAVTANLTLYAVFTAHEYTITYTLNEGTNHADNPSKFTVESDDIVLKAPTKQNYEFAGWTYGDVTTPVKEVTIAQGYHENITFVAHWLEEYTITYNDVEGATFVTENPTKYTIKTPTFTLNNPSKYGYTFVGWTYEGQDLPTTTVEITLGSTGAKEFTAVWSVEVTFDTNGATQNIPSSQTIVIKDGAKVARPTEDPAKYGYEFDGWYLENATNPYNFDTVVTTSLTLYAKWTLSQAYTVTFDSNEGSAVTEQTVMGGYTASEPVSPTRANKEFVGWFTKDGTNDDWGDQWNFTTDTVNAAMTLYAKWDNVKYTVKFNSKGGSAVASQKVEINTNVTKPQDPTRTGYKFVEWTLNSAAFDFATYEVTGDITLIAKWEVATFTVEFETNGGSTIDDMTDLEYDSQIVVANPTKTGYVFAGWYSDEQLTQEFDLEIESIQSDITLYADWKLAKYVVEFDTDGGTAISSQMVEHGKVASKPTNNPTKENLTFLGWFVSQEENAAEFDFASPITGATTIYAKWEQTSNAIDENLHLDYISGGNYSSFAKVTNPSSFAEVKGDCIGFTSGEIKFEVKAGALVVVSSYQTYINYTIAAGNQSADTVTNEQYHAYQVNADSTVVITGASGNYLTAIDIVYPIEKTTSYDWDLATEDANNNKYILTGVTGNGLVFTGNYNTGNAIQFKDTKQIVAFAVKKGAVVNITGHSGNYDKVRVFINNSDEPTELMYNSNTYTYTYFATEDSYIRIKSLSDSYSNSYLRKISISYPTTLVNEKITFGSSNSNFDTLKTSGTIVATASCNDIKTDNAQVKNGYIAMLVAENSTINISCNYNCNYVIKIGDNAAVTVAGNTAEVLTKTFTVTDASMVTIECQPTSAYSNYFYYIEVVPTV